MTARNFKGLFIIVGVIGLMAFPFIVKSDFYIHVFIMVMLWSMICLSLNIIFGYTGQLSLGHGALFGVGAYTCTILVTKVGLNFWLSLPAAAAAAGLVGLLIGIPSLKTKGPYFVIVTLGFNVIITEIIQNLEGLTGGVIGIYGIPKPSPIFTMSFETKVAQYFLVLVFLVFSLFLVHRMMNSLLGKSFVAIREDEDLAGSIGINTMRMKILSFTLSSFLVGIAGALFASYVGVVVPNDTSFHVAFDALVYLSVGGIGTLPGVIIGPLIISNIPEILRQYGNVMYLVNGGILSLIIIFMPQGVFGRLKEYWLKFLARSGEESKGKYVP